MHNFVAEMIDYHVRNIAEWQKKKNRTLVDNKSLSSFVVVAQMQKTHIEEENTMFFLILIVHDSSF